MAKTTISVDEMTRDRIAQLGHMRMTYDDVIVALLDFFEQKGGKL